MIICEYSSAYKIDVPKINKPKHSLKRAREEPGFCPWCAYLGTYLAVLVSRGGLVHSTVLHHVDRHLLQINATRTDTPLPTRKFFFSNVLRSFRFFSLRKQRKHYKLNERNRLYFLHDNNILQTIVTTLAPCTTDLQHRRQVPPFLATDLYRRKTSLEVSQ